MSTFRVIRNAAIILAIGISFSLLSQNASAQSCGYGGYGGGFSSVHGGGFGGAYRNTYNRSSFYNPGVNANLRSGIYHPSSSIRHPYSAYRVPAHTWHDTSHLDYIPPRVVPHRNHLDYIPGRRIWHQDGYIHYNHR